MKNPLRKYYFAYGESDLKKFDATIDAWFWKSPQDVVTELLRIWRDKYGDSVTIQYFGRL